MAENPATPHYVMAKEQERSTDEKDLDNKVANETGIVPLDDDNIAALTGAQFDDPNLDKEHFVALDDESPYPEVRSAVANTDDPDMPVTTLRTWVIGIAWAILIPVSTNFTFLRTLSFKPDCIQGLNQFFFFRFPSVTITGIVAQLLSFPVGRAAAAYVPNWRILGVSLNPGPFTVKEHVLITIMASVGAGSAYATDIVAVQRVYYNQTYNFSYQWFVVMSTQLIGFSIGGIARRFLVAPPSMIWPANLVNCALFNTLHSQYYAGIGARGGLSRERFFLYAFMGSFFWYFFPGYIFQALSYFSWVTWIRPDNTVIAQLFGYFHGMGMSVITFDWNQITYIGSPLATPWWAEANIFAGFVFFFWFLTPVLYFTNTWFGKFMPISSRTSYDNLMNSYNVSAILTDANTIDLDAYHKYSPLFISTTFAVSYGLSFASITATLMHAFLYFRKQIWVQSRRALHEQPDIHARLMSVYPQVPEWWYLILFLSMFVLGIISIEVWPTQMPVWAFVLALVISFTYVIPIGMIQAITNQQVGLNVITELIIGYALPGRPVAMMMFKTWGYITMAQGKFTVFSLTFASDFKLGHYMKIAPRPMFWSQVVATVIAGTVQLGVQAWMFTNIENICAPNQKDGFICPSTEVFGTASIIWGATVSLGRLRLTNDLSRRHRPTADVLQGSDILVPLVFFFLVGAAAPLIAWTLNRRYPNSFLKYVNPVIFNGTGLIPPATALNYVPWAGVGFIFQYVIRRRHFSWWTKYNYVLSAALDSGVAVSIIVIFFALQFPKNGTIGLTNIGVWWGNTVIIEGADYGPNGAGTPVQALKPGETFGCATEHLVSTRSEYMCYNNKKEGFRVPIRNFGFFGGGGFKSVKHGACDVAIRSAEISYSKNNLKCTLKFEVGRLAAGTGTIAIIERVKQTAYVSVSHWIRFYYGAPNSARSSIANPELYQSAYGKVFATFSLLSPLQVVRSKRRVLTPDDAISNHKSGGVTPQHTPQWSQPLRALPRTTVSLAF
ncbi:OPT oligopeptide transporter protein-domain-containing protein [Mycena rosella]|uniref:OPT oligopeptide transporter protein-domain-containing protein n=1 Tax=Mycena rosella TaxID=1033263 RepID=A0AAD7GHL9_MYCRO|nr:OPT oligopeptide transporter protein-domain-containing protein [Mycena rosella]